MKDLQILAEQQQQSQHQLQVARDTKQKKEGQLAKLEHTLGELKYEDGKLRTDLERSRESLALGQRQFLSIRSDAENAGSALRQFNEYVCYSLACSAFDTFFVD